MEIDSSLLETFLHSLMQLQGTLNDVLFLIFNTLFEIGEMTIQNGRVNDGERLSLWLWDRAQPEVSLESWVDVERTGGWVHAAHLQGVLDFSSLHGSKIVPMFIIDDLSEQRDGVLGVILIKLLHVQIIDEVDQKSFTFWSPSCTGFLLQWRKTELDLKDIGVGEVIEVDNIKEITRWIFSVKIF
jgi:hypothetical protein